MFLGGMHGPMSFAFGPRLKAHRERQGITLQDIADSTKISIALLAALERNDVSQWPKGIFRRAFLRSYADAVNLPFDATWGEFSRLFPEDGSAPSPAVIAEAASAFRLTLESGARLTLTPTASHLSAALADGLAIALLGWLASRALTATWALSTAVAGLAYVAIGTALFGGSIALRVIARLRVGQHHGAHVAEAPTLTLVSSDVTPRAAHRDAPSSDMRITLDVPEESADEPAFMRRARTVGPHIARVPRTHERRVADQIGRAHV